MSKLFYQIFIVLYPVGIRIAALFNPKAKQWLNGRKNIFDKLQASLKGNNNIIWMHCASLGEFEQGRPILEKLRVLKSTGQKILLTFFSPSGFDTGKLYDGADYVFYLPMDSKQNARLFFDIAKPGLVLFVKYEYWYHYLNEAKNRQIPLLLISSVFRTDQPFFKWYGGVYREMLASFHHFFVQNQASADLLRSLGFEKNVSVSGDTRFDRVIKIAEQFKPIASVEKFCGDSNVIVAGSTWTEDDKELDHFANSNAHIKFIIAPHNIGKDRIDECLSLYQNAITYSEWLKGDITKNFNTLIIDNIGMLSSLYFYADICYVGGAFGAEGVHNVLEPAVFGKPVIFGPEYEKFVEADELVETGGGFSIDNALELESSLQKILNNEQFKLQAGEKSKAYVYSKAGSTREIVDFIQEKRLLTN